MIATEAKLWRRFGKEANSTPGCFFTRIETEVALGVSDVEYVTPRMHGWIELKVSKTKTDFSPVVLSSPFTVHQYQWLKFHTNSSIGLKSWLLIGRSGTTQWREWALLPPSVALRFAQKESAEVPSWFDLRTQYRVFTKESHVVKYLLEQIK